VSRTPNAGQTGVEAGLRALMAEEGHLRLSAAGRTSLLREARSFRKAPASLPALLSITSRVPAFATLLAAFLIIGFAYFTTSTPVQSLSPKVGAGVVGPADLSISQVGGQVVLEWGDAAKQTYTVRQATTAKAVYSAPGVQVRGHRFVDTAPTDSPVVYYLVE